MIKDNQKLLNRLHVVLDALIIIFSYGVAWLIRFKSGFFELSSWYLSLEQYMKLLIYIVPLYLILYYAFHLYTSKRVQGRRLEAWHIVQANTVGLMFFVFYCVNIFLEVIVRNFIRMVLRKYRKQGYNQKHVLLIGYSRAAEGYLDRVLTHSEWGYIVNGILADNVPDQTEYRGVKVIGDTEKLASILQENQMDEIVITLGLSEYSKNLACIQSLFQITIMSYRQSLIRKTYLVCQSSISGMCR